MAALSRVWKLGDVYSRIANRCKNIENFNLEPESILRIMRLRINAVHAAAISAGKKYYYHAKSGTVASGQIDISGENFFEVQSLCYENGTQSRSYIECISPTHFNNERTAWNHETKVNGRYWFLVQGSDKILVYQGTDVVSKETALTIYGVRYPETDFSMQDVEDNNKYVDLPEFLVPPFADICAADAIKEQNLSIPQDLNGNFEAMIGSMTDRIAQTEAAAAAQKKDTL